MGYPIIKFHAVDTMGELREIKWFPSEYLFKQDSKTYCMTADKNNKGYEIVFGSSMMRQYDYIFDVENKQVGLARAECSYNHNMIKSEKDYIESGFDFGLVDEIADKNF